MAKRDKKNRYSGIGGQAVLEGVMMKNKDKYAVAIRKPNGEIDVDVEEYKGVCGGNKLTKIPFIRGVFNFVDSLVLGMKITMYSASFFEEEEEAPSKTEQKLTKLLGDKADDFVMGVTVAMSVILAVALFMLLPFFVSLSFK